MAAAYAQINPGNLNWARTRARLSIDALAEKLGLTADKIEAWEAGRKQPTFRQARQLADKTYIPFGYLFLKTLPKTGLPIPDLRTVDGRHMDEPSAELSKIVEVVLARQHWYQEYMQAQGESANPHIGRFNVQNNVDDIVADIRRVLDVGLYPKRGKWDDYLRDLIKRIEASGILVMKQGNLGHYSKPLNVSEFRGFALFDPVAPIIFINTADAPAAQLFTLIHELAHIWIGQSGVSDANPDTHRAEEVLCNAVAAEFLVPGQELLQLWNGCIDWQENLPMLEAHFRVSTWALARRALTLNLIDGSQYHQYINLLKKQWAQREKQAGGPTHYITKKSQVSSRFSEALVSEAMGGRVLLRDAGHLLAMKPNNIGKYAKELGL